MEKVEMRERSIFPLRWIIQAQTEHGGLTIIPAIKFVSQITTELFRVFIFRTTYGSVQSLTDVNQPIESADREGRTSATGAVLVLCLRGSHPGVPLIATILFHLLNMYDIAAVQLGSQMKTGRDDRFKNETPQDDLFSSTPSVVILSLMQPVRLCKAQ
jgi:hypothetical protein